MTIRLFFRTVLAVWLSLSLGHMTLTPAFGQGLHADSIEPLIEAARSWDRPGATLLVKGSRFMRMERVADALSPQPAPSSGGTH